MLCFVAQVTVGQIVRDQLKKIVEDSDVSITSTHAPSESDTLDNNYEKLHYRTSSK